MFIMRGNMPMTCLLGLSALRAVQVVMDLIPLLGDKWSYIA